MVVSEESSDGKLNQFLAKTDYLGRRTSGDVVESAEISDEGGTLQMNELGQRACNK